ncbi:MAG: asparagine synthase (glutamine-hydrolyzing) [Bacteroidetes bacterium]|nr:asparagine synthase (glutamine-hydrolyzing) [Bacteroidota bacterium]
MCGIAGYLSPNGTFLPQHLAPMAQAIAHRGPDAQGLWQDEVCGLAHRRLSILDLSTAANQPMVSHCERYRIVFNGEVFNYRDIAREMGIAAHTTSDTEVVLEALIREGIDACHRFNGMFAIAWYDTLEKRLTLIRDRFGIKPIVYHWDGRSLAFASEVKALCTLPISRQIDLQSVQDYLFLEYVPGDRTIWDTFRKLPAGHWLQADANGLKQGCWYNILDRATLPKIDHNYLEDRLLETLSDSIRYRQIADVPLGAFLSGGTDSSLIAAVYQQQNNHPVRTFTIGFDDPQYNESQYAEAVAQHLKTRHQTTPLRLADARARLADIFTWYDEPFAVSSTLPTLLLSEVTRREVTVALSGDGGDELFMGYGYYYWWQRWQKVNRLGGQTARKALAWLLTQGDARKRRAARVFAGPGDDSWWLHIWSQDQYMFSQAEVGKLTRQPYRHSTLLADWRQMNELPLHPWEKISLFDIRNYLANNLLYKVDIASMAHALEVRVPFLDYRVVELALRTPPALKMNASEQKILPKKLLTRFLPQEMVYRKKWGFPAPVGEWLNGPLKYLVDDLLESKRIQQQGIFNHLEINKLVRDFQSGKHPYHHKRVMALVFFQLWYQRHAQ